jgi:predicted dehydrogenase
VGYPERLELHGTKGTAIITGDKLTTWDVENDVGDPPPLMSKASSGASDPMAISIFPFERQFQDFAQACNEGREPMCSGMDGFRALQVVTGLCDSC